MDSRCKGLHRSLKQANPYKALEALPNTTIEEENMSRLLHRKKNDNDIKKIKKKKMKMV